MTDFTEDFSTYAVSKLPNFKDKFNLYPTQTLADNSWIPNLPSNQRVSVTDENIFWDMIREGTDNRIVFDLGTSVSETNWTLRLHLHVNSGGVLGSPQGNYSIGLGDTDVSQLNRNNKIAWALLNSSGGRQYIFADIVGGVLNNSDLSALGTYTSPDDLFLEMTRTSANEARMRIYSDENFSTLQDEQIIAVGDVTNLRYLILSCSDDAGVFPGTETGTVDNIEFWGISQPVPTPSTFNDNFVTDNFTNINGTRVLVNTGTEVMDWASSDAVLYNDGEFIDVLGATIDTSRWILRFKLNVNTSSIGADGTANSLFVGFSDDNTSLAGTVQDFAGLQIFRQASDNTGAFRIMGADGTAPNVSAGSDTALIPTVDTYFVEFIRNGSTITARIYSDSTFTTLTESVSRAIVVGVTGLRYLKAMVSNRDGSGDHTFDGTIDDVKFWNGVAEIEPQAIVFEDDFANATNWTQTGSQVTIASGEIQGWGADGGTQRLTHDLVTPLSDKSWTAEFEFEFSASTNPAHDILVLTDTDGTSSELQDHIACRFGFSGGLIQFGILRGDNGQLGSGTILGVTASINTRYFVRLQRISPSLGRLTVFTGGFGSVLFGTVDVDLSGITGLRFVISETSDLGGAGRTLTGIIDNLKLTSEVSDSGVAQQGDLTFEDDFELKTATFTDDFSGTDDWDDTGTRNAVNTTTDVIDWDGVRDSTNQSTSFDLGVAGVNDEKWTYRWKVVVDNVSTPSVNNQSVYFAVDSVDHSVNANSASHTVCLLRAIRFSSGVSEWGLHSVSSGTYGGTESDFTHTLVAETLYIELKRTSATQFECSFFSDATYTTLIERITSTIPANVTNLRYLVVKNWNGDTSTGGSLDGTMDDVEFYNGDSTLTRWLGAIGNDVRLNVIDERIDFDPPTGVDRDELVAFDLQTILGSGVNADDENWTLRFKINVDTLVQGSSEESASLFIGLDNNLDSTATQTHNLIIFRTTMDQGGAGPQFGKISSSLSRLGGGYTSGGTGTATQFPIAWSTGTRYVEVKRLSPTETLTTLYTDASFTDIETNSSGVPLSVQDTIDSGIINLRYIRVTTDSSAVANDTSYDGSIDDIEFYNGVSVTKTPLLEVKDFEDNLFTDTNWTQTGSGLEVNTGTQVIDWTSVLDNTNKAIIHDLGATISNTEWTLRFKWTFDSEVVPIAPNQGKYMWIGLFSADGASDSNTVQDAITFFHSKSVSNNILSIGERNNVILTNAGTDHEFSNAVDMVVGDIRYVELKRISSTIAECALYSDRDYSILVERIRVTIASGIVNLRYIGIKNRNTAESGVGSQTGTIDDIEFWDGGSGKTHKKVWLEVDE